ncbi:MAG TPA: MBL fold metallo-hydrolase [Anaerolineaceae bacterium]|nr:MBL fold metallo-hydrolase [Anaerolineaceae bacterium]
MIIHFDGAAHTVTGSQHLLELDGRRLLLDCGLYQGKRSESNLRNRTFDFDPQDVDAVILSHAHIDHSGNLPNLVKQGFAGQIYTTGATAQMADVMLRDSGHIQEADAEFINKRIAEKGSHEPPVKPLYTTADAAEVARHFRPVEYDQEFHPLPGFPGLTAHLVDAGHILGSAAVVLDIQEPGRAAYRLWFSGDIGQRNLALINDPVLPEGVEYLIMESTYGDTRHADPGQAETDLCEAVHRTIKRGGKVIIPAFAVGRTQELVYALNKMFQRGDLPPVPVYVDSPLAVEASDVFQKNAEYFDEETHAFMSKRNREPLDFPSLHYIQSVDESKSLNGRRESMIIISASGMAETGRILHHLKNNIEDPKNTILIVSYQAPETLGRRLVDQAHTVRIFGESYVRRAEVISISGFSAHADRNMLIEYALATKDTLKRVMLVHGEPDAARSLQAALLDRGIPEVDYPELHEAVEV